MHFSKPFVAFIFLGIATAAVIPDVAVREVKLGDIIEDMAIRAPPTTDVEDEKHHHKGHHHHHEARDTDVEDEKRHHKGHHHHHEARDTAVEDEKCHHKGHHHRSRETEEEYTSRATEV